MASQQKGPGRASAGGQRTPGGWSLQASLARVKTVGVDTDAVQSWLVPEGKAGDRLDRHLSEVLGASRSEVRYLLATGRVSVGGSPVSGSAKGRTVSAGDEIRVRGTGAGCVPRPLGDRALADRLRELGRGPGWLAVDKPPGCGVHPLRANQSGTLLNGLLERYPELWGIGEGGLRSGVVHRLDVDTSGVVLFASHQPTWEALRAAFAAGAMDKRYWAVTAGTWGGRGEAELALAVTQRSPARVRVYPAGGAPRGLRTWRTHLRWKVLATTERASLVEVRPTTGFLHQIRVTLAHLGHPVLGDARYGAGPSAGISRHLLHAARLRCDRFEIDVASPEPDDFRRARERFGLPGVLRPVTRRPAGG